MSVLAFLCAVAIGTVVAACRVSPVPSLRFAGTFYVDVFRNIPLAVLLVLFFFGLTKVGVKYPAFQSAVIVLAVYTGAFVAEAVRSGINSVAGGQAEAARSLGLGFLQTLFLIVMPQAFRAVVAPLGSLFIALTKNSAIAATIGVIDLTYVADKVGNETARPLQTFIGAGIAYLIITYPSGLIIGVVERKLAIKR